MSIWPPSNSDSPGVRLPPPLIFLAFLLLGLGLDSAWIKGHLADMVSMVAGGVLLLIGFFISVTTAPRHKQAGSNVEPWKPTAAIIADGLYAYSRNPLYVAMAIAYLGFAVAGGSRVAVVMLPLCLLVIRYYVIAREERYLEAKFGDGYLAYKTKVRRWL